MHSYILHILKRFRKAVQSYMLMLYAKHGSTARQLDSSTARTDLDRPRQLLDAQAHAVSLDGLDSYSTATRQLLDRLDKQGLADSPSTAARRFGCSGGARSRPNRTSTGAPDRRGHGCAPGLNQGSGRQAGPQCVGSRSVNGASGPARRYRHPRLYYYPWARREKPVASKRSARFQSLTGPPRGAQNLHAIIGVSSAL